MEEENISKVKVNVKEGAQINIAFGNGTIYAEQNNRNKDIIDRSKIKSRTQEYADKWNENMFLNDFDKRDENAGVNVKLKDVYLNNHLPHYIWKGNKKESNDLMDLLVEYIYGHCENKMLLVLGQPGIGKSSLITWMIANFNNAIDRFLVYQFAADLKYVDWQTTNKKYDITDNILRNLGIKYRDLEGKILILDGFDEINAGDARTGILERLYHKLIKESSLNNFFLFITCRENYIQGLNCIGCDYITLQSWDCEQIRSFCKIYTNMIKRDVSEVAVDKLYEKKEIFGTPLILYMVLALDISIEEEGSVVDIFDQIFSLEGGIYERCIANSRYENPHRINLIKEEIHMISEKIAFWMFEYNNEKASIPQEEYRNICDTVMQTKENKEDFLIGNYFKLVNHCGGIDTKELYFVHRSIYEYFVAEYIFNSLKRAINLSKENFAGILGRLFEKNVYIKKYLSF